MKTKQDKTSHLSNAYWHLDLIQDKSPEVQMAKNLIELLISKDKERK